MKVLIAGASGQVACSLARAGAGAGAGAGHSAETIALGRPDLDLLNADSIAKAMDEVGPDVVINAAAYTAVDKAEDDEKAAFALNCNAAEALAAAACTANVPIIHISTDYVYDGSKSAAYEETDPPAPLGVYGRSKFAGESAVAAANPQHLIFRTAWVYSPFGNNFVKTMLRLAADRDALNVVDDQIGNPSYAPHIADGLLQIAKQITSGTKTDPSIWGVYHLSGQGETSWCGLAKEVFAVSKAAGGVFADVSAIPSSAYPTPAKRPANSRLDNTKLAQVFGVTLPSWREGVADCVQRLAV